MDKHEVAAALDEIAMLMELSGENPFKVRSYANAARRVEQLEEDLELLVRDRRLREIPGVGDALEEKIAELAVTGRLAFLDELRAKFPPALPELFAIPGLGPKRIRQLYEAAGIDSLDALDAALRAGSLPKLKGFSGKLLDKLREGIAFARQHAGQHLGANGHNAAAALIKYLRETPGVQRIDVAGSLRRRKEVVKDIDLVASSSDPAALMQRFAAYPEVRKATGQGDTKSSVVLAGGMACDLRVVDDAAYPFVLAHFTGSKDHNVVMRQRAKDRGLKLNEYGLFDAAGRGLPCRGEEDLYAALGLPFIPPELREDRGEFELKTAPALIDTSDLRGVIHCHSTYSDGVNSIEEMALAAKARGYEYLVMCDHSQSAAYAGGMKPERVLEQFAEIEKLNRRLKPFTVLKGIESDIRLDGALDYDAGILPLFDLVVASVHSKLDMTEAEATRRVLRAIENPYTHVLGHPTGRLLLRREGYPLDWDAVFAACARHGVALEINANPHRLDLDWRLIRRARDRGCRFSIGPDAHRIEGLDCMPLGVGIGRKGWLERGDVINTLSARELIAWRRRP